MSSTRESLERERETLARYRQAGADDRYIERCEEKIAQLQAQLEREEREIRPHPALQFGPVAQTIAFMAAVSLAMSVAPLPREMVQFYTLFSRLTIVAVICLVTRASIIWYAYREAVARLAPAVETPEQKLRKMLKSKSDRPDLWAHTRSHPSLFLTTRHAPPRLFPFPLGKTRPEATVKDELWWEGGNAPHVGHFNRPKIAEPTGPDPETLMEKFKESIEIEKQQKLWAKRIRTIQYLCGVVILAFVNRNVAIAVLCWLIYTTVSNELDGMLAPPEDMEPIQDTIDLIAYSAGRNQSTPKPKKGQPSGGMSYIYDPKSASNLEHQANIPIVSVPPPVLMTTDNIWLAGPG